jgi:hypothetical protein
MTTVSSRSWTRFRRCASSNHNPSTLSTSTSWVCTTNAISCKHTPLCDDNTSTRSHIYLHRRSGVRHYLLTGSVLGVSSHRSVKSYARNSQEKSLWFYGSCLELQGPKQQARPHLGVPSAFGSPGQTQHGVKAHVVHWVRLLAAAMPTKARTTSERMRVEIMVNEWGVLALVVVKVQVMMEWEREAGRR